jgi:hypothetical protein
MVDFQQKGNGDPSRIPWPGQDRSPLVFREENRIGTLAGAQHGESDEILH